MPRTISFFKRLEKKWAGARAEMAAVRGRVGGEHSGGGGRVEWSDEKRLLRVRACSYISRRPPCDGWAGRRRGPFREAGGGVVCVFCCVLK